MASGLSSARSDPSAWRDLDAAALAEQLPSSYRSSAEPPAVLSVPPKWSALRPPPRTTPAPSGAATVA